MSCVPESTALDISKKQENKTFFLECFAHVLCETYDVISTCADVPPMDVSPPDVSESDVLPTGRLANGRFDDRTFSQRMFRRRMFRRPDVSQTDFSTHYAWATYKSIKHITI